jgi:2,3-bisphosphoglycerate-dependent phosphoglycerate mutase
MRLYLIRHAQSGNNVLIDEIGRSHDPTLTPVGEHQAQKLASYLATQPDMPTGPFGQERNPDDMPYRFTHLYCSAMHRAVQTAYAVGQAMKMRPVIWRDTHEVGGIYLDEPEGRSRGFPGLTRTEMLNYFPEVDLSEEVSETGWWPVESGRESWDQAAERARGVAQVLLQRAETNPEDQVALVTHGAFMSMVLQWLLTDKNNPGLYYTHYNTAITRVDFNDRPDTLRLHYLNRLDHLTSDERTY